MLWPVWRKTDSSARGSRPTYNSAAIFCRLPGRDKPSACASLSVYSHFVPLTTMPQTATFNIPALDCPDELALIERGLRSAGCCELGARLFRASFVWNLIRLRQIQLRSRQLVAPVFPPKLRCHLLNHNCRADRPQNKKLLVPIVTSALLLLRRAAVRLAREHHLACRCAGHRLRMRRRLVGAEAAWRAIRLRGLDMNVLMTIAGAGAIAIGDYFEAATAMFLFAVSLWLERLSLTRARTAIRSLLELAPTVAIDCPEPRRKAASRRRESQRT